MCDEGNGWMVRAHARVVCASRNFLDWRHVFGDVRESMGREFECSRLILESAKLFLREARIAEVVVWKCVTRATIVSELVSGVDFLLQNSQSRGYSARSGVAKLGLDFAHVFICTCVV